MCGIFGYIGERDPVPLLIDGLKRLEYRGYDSAGIAILNRGKIMIEKCVGKIADLEKVLQGKKELTGHIGIGHTRWATHGEPSDINSHPHTDCTGEFVVIHNGIIENYASLKKELEAEGHKFKSATDTEVLAHLVEKFFKRSVEEAVKKALQTVEGSYAISVVYRKEPDKMIVARHGSPLVIGLGKGDNFVASDIPAMLRYTDRVIYLNDGEIGIVTRDQVRIKNLEGDLLNKEVSKITWSLEQAEKGGFPHFMLKEIHEQPKAILDTIAGRVDGKLGEVYFEKLNISNDELKKINRIVFTACGTSWHSGLIGEYLIEQHVKIPAEVEYAAEFRYRNPILDKNTLVIGITQSGETADTLAALREAKKQGAKVISICNVVGSTIARESAGVIYTHAGPEIGVASTKAFSTQLVVLYLFTLYLAKLKGSMPDAQVKKMINNLLDVPEEVEKLLIPAFDKRIKEISERYYKSNNALYLGRGEGFPIALEGALKLKEVSYIHAEGYPAAEMKHGPIALIDANMPVVVLAMKGRRYDKIMGNIAEVKARGGKVIALASEGDDDIQSKADEVIYIPIVSEDLSPILAVIPLQLLAYYIAIKRGCHVDQPRNLAKSVTVE